MLQQRSITVLTADAYPGFRNGRKHQNTDGFAEQFAMRGIGAGKSLQRVGDCSVDYLFGISTCRDAGTQRENKQRSQRDYNVLSQHDCPSSACTYGAARES
jgi:hypothetical protein